MNGLLKAALICASLCVLSADSTAEEVWRINPAILKCSPKVIRYGKQIKITLGKGHGRELAVKRDSFNLSWFLVVASPPRDMKSLMSPDEFARTKELTIPIGTTGYRWDAKGGNEPLFAEPGTYTIFASENLESEVGGYKCKIKVR